MILPNLSNFFQSSGVNVVREVSNLSNFSSNSHTNNSKSEVSNLSNFFGYSDSVHKPVQLVQLFRQQLRQYSEKIVLIKTKLSNLSNYILILYYIQEYSTYRGGIGASKVGQLGHLTEAV